jgi:BirA family transcriptional regulator, biotin operon repressor / biotin---[acetyl-CoA-carboxylase] ligase
MSPKDKILKRLIEADNVLSGEVISAQLGISRVSVWKHIKGLIASGVSISSSPKGYRLISDPDSLAAWEFGARAGQIHYFSEVSSTMDTARAMAREGCPDHTVVVAQRQTHGRGRLKRTWSSADGGLYFSVVARPTIPVMVASLVNLAAAVHMADTIRSLHHIEAILKWPNDIYANQQKLCGILSQMEAEGDQIAYINIGIGLNVNNDPETNEPRAISLKSLLGRSVPRREILEAFLDRFEKQMAHFDPLAVIARWRANNMTIGRAVRIQTINNAIEGTAVDIDALGGLVLRLADGRRQTVVHGDCFEQ